MRRMTRASSYVTVVACLALSATSSSRQAQSQPAASSGAAKLDYAFFKAKVEPVFLTKRPGRSRPEARAGTKSSPARTSSWSSGWPRRASWKAR
jgi:hypothetical protein